MFDAQLLMLDDPMLVSRVADIVREQRVNAEWAVQQVFHEFSSVFDEVADPYLRERKGDVSDLAGRLKMNLRQGVATPRDLLRELDESSVIIADELTPSLAAQVDWTKVRGFATDAGSRTSHTAILARSLEVPAVVGLHNASGIVQAGQLVVIDGTASELIVDPTTDDAGTRARTAEDHRPAVGGDAERRRPAATADGVRIRLEANIEFPDDLAAARYAGAEGIGLYRSEFLLTGSSGAAWARTSSTRSTAACSRAWRPGRSPCGRSTSTRISSRCAPDAPAARRRLGGGRGARQPSGAARASAEPDAPGALPGAAAGAAARGAASLQGPQGQLRIMFPFVSSVEQLREARRMVKEAAAELARRGEAVPTVPIGVMIEIPAAAYTADLLAREVDFLHDRHQRSDSVLPGGRSRGRARLAAVRAAASGDPAGDRHGAAGGGAAPDSRVALRRDGVGPRAADAAGGTGADGVQHDAGRDSGRQAGPGGSAHRTICGPWRAASCGWRRSKTLNAS